MTVISDFTTTTAPVLPRSGLDRQPARHAYPPTTPCALDNNSRARHTALPHRPPVLQPRLAPALNICRPTFTLHPPVTADEQSRWRNNTHTIQVRLPKHLESRRVEARPTSTTPPQPLGNLANFPRQRPAACTKSHDSNNSTHIPHVATRPHNPLVSSCEYSQTWTRRRKRTACRRQLGATKATRARGGP